MDVRIGELIPRYRSQGLIIDGKELEILGQLGKGASGSVYKASYRDELVAVKIYEHSVLSQDFQSCTNEMDIMCAMRHENIIPVKGLVLNRSPLKVGVVMALAPKGELGDALYKNRIIKRGGSAMRFKIAIGMAQALKFLHANNVIHRDIKPANVLLGEDGQALLTDFGYSRYIDHSGHMTGETGSYRWMAPEVTQSGKYSEKADVFSWAVVVNELFCGEKPYEFQMPLDVARSVVINNLRPSQKRIRNLRLKNLIASAWDAQPTQRPDWDEIIEQLEKARLEVAATKSRTVKHLATRLSGMSSGGDR